MVALLAMVFAMGCLNLLEQAVRGVRECVPAQVKSAIATAVGCAFAGLFVLPVAAKSVLPTGQTVTLSEVLTDTVSGEDWLRFRFLAPGIAQQAIPYDQAAGDMQVLCEQIALPHLAAEGLNADRIVISLSDRFVPFGQADPEATQYFDLFRPEGGVCVWEEF